MKTNTLFLVLMLVASNLFAQKTELKQDTLVNESFDKDTFDNIFSFAGKGYTRKTGEFARLKLLPGSRVHFNSDSLKTKLSTFGGKYDSIQVEISFAHRFGIMNKVGFVYLNSQKDYVFNDVDTHVVKATFKGVENQNFFAFKNYDSSTSIYVNYIKVYGYRIDTIPSDTPTTGLGEDITTLVKAYNINNTIVINNSSSLPLSVKVWDLTGQIISSINIIENEMKVLISKAGIYILLIEDKKGNIITQKVFIP